MNEDGVINVPPSSSTTVVVDNTGAVIATGTSSYVSASSTAAPVSISPPIVHEEDELPEETDPEEEALKAAIEKENREYEMVRMAAAATEEEYNNQIKEERLSLQRFLKKVSLKDPELKEHFENIKILDGVTFRRIDPTTIPENQITQEEAPIDMFFPVILTSMSIESIINDFDVGIFNSSRSITIYPEPAVEYKMTRNNFIIETMFKNDIEYDSYSSGRNSRFENFMQKKFMMNRYCHIEDLSLKKFKAYQIFTKFGFGEGQDGSVCS